MGLMFLKPNLHILVSKALWPLTQAFLSNLVNHCSSCWPLFCPLGSLLCLFHAKPSPTWQPLYPKFPLPENFSPSALLIISFSSSFKTQLKHHLSETPLKNWSFPVTSHHIVNIISFIISSAPFELFKILFFYTRIQTLSGQQPCLSYLADYL